VKPHKILAVISSVMFLVTPSNSYAASLGNGVTNPQPFNPSDPNAPQPGVVALDKQYPVGSTVNLSDSRGIQGGDQLTWVHDGRSDTVHWIVTDAVFPDGSTGGKILQYDIDTTNINNGHLLVAQSDYPDWVTALGGNQKYVDTQLAKLGDTSYLDFGPNEWQVHHLSNVINLSGATIDQGVLTAINDGWTAQGSFAVHPTPPPTSSVTTDQTAYAPGDQVDISLSNTTYAQNTSQHFEALEVIGPNGFDKFLPINDNGTTIAAATGTNFPYTPSDQNVTVLAPNDPIRSDNPSATTTETATLDTKGLPAGTYTLKYTVYDGVARPSSSGTNGTVVSTFTIDPKVPPKSNGGSGSANGGGNNGGSNNGGSQNGGGSGSSGGNSGGSKPTPLPTGGNPSGSTTNPGGGGDGDISVRFRNHLFNHLPKDGETGTLECVLRNDNSYDGYIKYTIDGYADNSLTPPIHKEGIAAIGANSEVSIPLSYTIKKKWQGDFQLGYHMIFNAQIEPYTPPSSDPDDPPPPPLNDDDTTNDSAKLVNSIPGSTHLTQ
jgi:uncharacterized membrane protein YgcG